jgi:hypothetical protein
LQETLYDAVRWYRVHQPQRIAGQARPVLMEVA